jgi:hypothetical protein
MMEVVRITGATSSIRERHCHDSRVRIDNSTSQQPASAVCVLDVSYSMGFPATMHGVSEG